MHVIKTFRQPNDPDADAEKNRILELYAITDGTVEGDRDEGAGQSAGNPRSSVVMVRATLRPLAGWVARGCGSARLGTGPSTGMEPRQPQGTIRATTFSMSGSEAEALASRADAVADLERRYVRVTRTGNSV